MKGPLGSSSQKCGINLFETQPSALACFLTGYGSDPAQCVRQGALLTEKCKLSKSPETRE